jgi:hypothetical protein
MANEAVCIETPTRFRRYTIADATAVPIGSIMILSDANTCALSSADNGVFAGIAWEEKTLSDGLVEITCAVNGTWDITTTNAAITAGAWVSIGGANLIRAAAEADTITGELVGKALETCAATETIRVAVGELC